MNMQATTPTVVLAPLFMGCSDLECLAKDNLQNRLCLSEACQVLPVETLLSAAGEDMLSRADSVLALYLPPWCYWASTNGSQTPLGPDMASAMDLWVQGVRRLLSSHKILRKRLRFTNVLDHTAESFTQYLESSLSLNSNALNTLEPLFGAFESRMPLSLQPLLESFFREHFKELADLHDAVVPILEGAAGSRLDVVSSSSGTTAKAISLEALKTVNNWYASVHKSKVDGASASEQERVQVELKLKSAEEEAELLLLQLHQVQEELESYYLSNKDLKRILVQSTQTIRRARHLALAE